jgi:hypothetical protein
VVDALVKMLGCAVVVGAVVVAVFAGVVFFVVTGSTDDQSALTSEVAADVVSVERRSAGPDTPGYEYEFDIAYTYDIGGQTFGADTTLSENQWGRGDALPLCVDPDDPAAHVVKTEADPCGSESVTFGKISTGEPTTAP